jgi:hypothetical protein
LYVPVGIRLRRKFSVPSYQLSAAGVEFCGSSDNLSTYPRNYEAKWSDYETNWPAQPNELFRILFDGAVEGNWHEAGVRRGGLEQITKRTLQARAEKTERIISLFVRCGVRQEDLHGQSVLKLGGDLPQITKRTPPIQSGDYETNSPGAAHGDEGEEMAFFAKRNGAGPARRGSGKTAPSPSRHCYSLIEDRKVKGAHRGGGFASG